MKIRPKLESSITLSECVYYGLFIHDTKIILPFEKPTSLKLFDVSKPNGKCFHTEECPSAPYGLCHSRVNETLDEVYVSFKSIVVLYHIDVEDTAKFTKLQTINLHVNESMLAISSGLSTVFSANNVKAFICSHDFNVEYDVTFKNTMSKVPFISSSWKSDYHCFCKDGKVVVKDGNNKNICHSDRFQDDLRGLTFDLHDNVLVCTRTSKLKQIRCGGRESRDIVLDSNDDSCNVALHPTGEKMLVLDYNMKCCVYQVL